MADMPLYLPEAKIAELILGKRRVEDWPLIAAMLEQEEGFPPINPVFGMRYWPGIVKWFEKYENVELLIDGRHSGRELPCTPGRKRRGSNADRTQTAQVVSIGTRARPSKKSVTDPPKSA